jgi:transposase-like protein
MPRPHPPEFRRRAVELARLREKPTAQIAKDLGQLPAQLDVPSRHRRRPPRRPLESGTHTFGSRLRGDRGPRGGTTAALDTHAATTGSVRTPDARRNLERLAGLPAQVGVQSGFG